MRRAYGDRQMAAATKDDQFSMRTSEQDRSDWAEGKKLMAEATGLDVTVADFIRVAAREKLARLKEEKGKRKAR